MRTFIFLIGVLGMPSGLLAAPHAISCDVTRTIELSGAKTSTQDKITSVFVLDDDRRTVEMYWEPAGALYNQCTEPDCAMTYGASRIMYGSLGNDAEFNRETGAYTASATLDDKRLRFSGTCQPTEMPRTLSPTRKF
jgi:hypothetical protein